MISFGTNKQRNIFCYHILAQWNETRVWCYISHQWEQMHPTLEVKNNVVIRGETKVWIHMGFNLRFHVVQVPNYIIASTIVYACGKFPSPNHIKGFCYMGIKGCFRAILARNQQALYVCIQQNLIKSCIVEDDKWTTLLWMLVGSNWP